MKITAIVLAASITISALAVFVYFAPGNRFRRDYAILRLGLTPSETDAIFGKSPEFECSFRQYRIRYFRCPIFYGHVPERMPSSEPVQSPDKIPYIYAAAQLMFDREGKLVAYTMNGETAAIHTTQGTLNGDRLDRLNESHFP